MKFSFLIMTILIFLGSSCSFNKDLTYEDAYDGHPSEKSSSDIAKEKKEAEEAALFSIEEEYDDEDDEEMLVADDADDAVSEEDQKEVEGLNLISEEGSSDDGDDELYEDEEDMLVVDNLAVAATPNFDNLVSYEVRKGETLMMIAFKLYGDYGRWKELAEVNSIQGNIILSGSVIKYQKPDQPFVWQPEGTPHLLTYGDTLGKVSEKAYGRGKHWEYIWNNNRPMIKDPDKIFAGFTIFTVPLNEDEKKKKRGVSSL